MQKKLVLIVVAAVVALGLIGFFAFGGKKTNQAVAASAQQAKVESEITPIEGTKQWALRCDKFKDVKAGTRKEYCEAVIRALTKKTNQRIIEFAVGYPDLGKPARGVFILPLGMLLDSPMSLQLDGQAPLGFKVRYCTGDGCFAFVTFDEALLKKLSSSKNLVINGTAQTGQPVKLEVPMNEFSKAMAEPRLKPNA